jgi:hypothetical protein
MSRRTLDDPVGYALDAEEWYAIGRIGRLLSRLRVLRARRQGDENFTRDLAWRRAWRQVDRCITALWDGNDAQLRELLSTSGAEFDDWARHVAECHDPCGESFESTGIGLMTELEAALRPPEGQRSLDEIDLLPVGCTLSDAMERHGFIPPRCGVRDRMREDRWPSDGDLAERMERIVDAQEWHREYAQ